MRRIGRQSYHSASVQNRRPGPVRRDVLRPDRPPCVNGRARLVRHGHLPKSEVMTGTDPVPVKVPRVRDRRVNEVKITLTSSILQRLFPDSDLDTSRHKANPSLYGSKHSSENGLFQDNVCDLVAMLKYHRQ